ncbi:MAG TPA: hypothetical protein DCQ84_14045 [Candidatus Competibacteraceae bacterium]|nr:hypothetical protein [Candidatus Competibacteraceae bacterium]
MKHDEKDETAERLEMATSLLQECYDGFGAFINGRKMKRNERDVLRAKISDFLFKRQIKRQRP